MSDDNKSGGGSSSKSPALSDINHPRNMAAKQVRKLRLEQAVSNRLEALKIAEGRHRASSSMDRVYLFANLALLTFVTALLYFFPAVFLPALLALVFAHLLINRVIKIGNGLERIFSIFSGFISNTVASQKRLLATLIIFIIMVVSSVLVFYMILPEMLEKLVDNLPTYLDNLQPHVNELNIKLDLKEYVDTAVNGALSDGGHLMGSVLSIAGEQLGNSMHIVEFTVLTILYTVGMIMNWETVVGFLKLVMNKVCTPDGYEDKVDQFAADIGNALSGYARGKMIVMSLMMAYYSIAYGAVASLWLGEGLPMWFLLGMLSGFLCVMPIIGMAFGLALTAAYTTALLPDTGWSTYLFIISTGAAGFLLEGKILDPHFVGSRIKVHGILVIFAIVAGASMGGLFGMFIATPTLAILTVIVPMLFYGFIDHVKPETRRARHEAERQQVREDAEVIYRRMSERVILEA